MTKMALENGKAAGAEVEDGGAMAVTAVSEIFEIKMNTVNLMSASKNFLSMSHA
jgi:hypothetical protein